MANSSGHCFERSDDGIQYLTLPPKYNFVCKYRGLVRAMQKAAIDTASATMCPERCDVVATDERFSGLLKIYFVKRQDETLHSHLEMRSSSDGRMYLFLDEIERLKPVDKDYTSIQTRMKNGVVMARFDDNDEFRPLE
jgi:hypothetical protein